MISDSISYPHRSTNLFLRKRMSDDLIALFESVGLSAAKAQETAANKKLALVFQSVIAVIILIITYNTYY